MTSTTKKTDDRWVPVKGPGDRFCAPACGMGCTHTKYKIAVAAARKLAKRLGPTWKPEVWENLGWHYKAVSACRRWQVYANTFTKTTSYTAFIGDGKSIGGTWTESAEDPHEAIANALKVAKADIAERIACIEPEPAWLRDGQS